MKPVVLALVVVIVPTLTAAQVDDHLQCFKIRDELKLKGMVDLTSP